MTDYTICVETSTDELTVVSRLANELRLDPYSSKYVGRYNNSTRYIFKWDVTNVEGDIGEFLSYLTLKAGVRVYEL